MGDVDASDYLEACAQGAATGLFIGVIDGTDFIGAGAAVFIGAGAAVNAGVGCGDGLAATAVDQLTGTEAGTAVGQTNDDYELADAVTDLIR